MDVFGFFRSSASYRLRIALNLKRLSPNQHFINLRNAEGSQPAYREINPSGLVPTLINGKDVITQSMAIIEYLDEVYPKPSFLPDHAGDRAFVRSIALAIACDIHPLNNLRVLKYLEGSLEISKDNVSLWYEHWIVEGFAALETTLASDERVGSCCFGDSPTLADIFLLPQVANAERMSCSLEPYPTIHRIAAHLRSIPEFAAAEPALQPDAIN